MGLVLVDNVFEPLLLVSPTWDCSLSSNPSAYGHTLAAETAMSGRRKLLEFAHST